MQERRLAAIMFTDIVGYTALMGSDEDRAFEVLAKNRKIHTKLIQQFNGTLIKEMGDGMLISFDLASQAVRCAVEIQKACLAQDIPLKTGIHEGEMVFEGNDVLGDGVNIASRIQDGAEEGCIMISGSVYRDIKNKADIHAEFVQERQFKNVDEKIRIYRVNCGGENAEVNAQRLGNPFKKLVKSPFLKSIFIVIGFFMLFFLAALIWRTNGILSSTFKANQTSSNTPKSIAVLPFINLSGDQEKEFMSDGFTDAINMNLVKIKSFDKIVPLTSVISYRTTEKPASVIGYELEVSYILQGTYLQERDRVRVSVSLIESKNNNTIWVNQYDKSYQDIFSIQSEIPIAISQNISVFLTDAEHDKINEVPTKNMEAYELYQKAAIIQKGIRQYDISRDTIKGYLEKAIVLDPEFAAAYGLLGLYHVLDGNFWGDRPIAIAALNAKPYIEKALELDPNEPWSLIAKALVYGWAEWRYELTGEYLLKAIRQLPQGNTYSSWYGFYLYLTGRNLEALDYVKELEKTGYKFDLSTNFQYTYIMSLLKLGRVNEAAKLNQKFLQQYDSAYHPVAARYFYYLDQYDSVLHYISSIRERDYLVNLPLIRATKAIAFFKLEEHAKSDSIVNLLKESSQQKTGIWEYWISCFYSSTGQIDSAFYWLERAYRIRSAEMSMIRASIFLDELKDDPRYWDLYEKTGHAAYDEYLKSEGI